MCDIHYVNPMEELQYPKACAKQPLELTTWLRYVSADRGDSKKPKPALFTASSESRGRSILQRVSPEV